MKYTEHYQLNQWDAADRVLREDFNRDNEKIETALAAVQDQLNGLQARHTLQPIKTFTAAATQYGRVTCPMDGIAWSDWNLIHVFIDAKMKADMGYRILFNNSDNTLLSGCTSKFRTHLIFFSFCKGESPVTGIRLFGGSFFWNSASFQSCTALILAPAYDEYPLMAGTKLTLYGQK